MFRALMRMFFLFILLNLAHLLAQSEFPRGTIVEKVVCLRQPNQSYSLYLPSNYAPDAPRPILYCFDPAARGRVPVELFREPAEKLGHIVVGSNNSRNGPWGPIQEAIQALWDDTHVRFALDPRRFYTAGMSGGGGPAWHLAASGAAGTIICASVLELREEVLQKVSFAFFATAGLADFNYPYLDRDTETLLRFRKPARFETFEGAHGWPPPALAAEALVWMELQAMKSGLEPRSQGFVDREFQRRKTQAESLEAQGKLWDAWMAWRNLALDFADLLDTTACESRALALDQDKSVRQRRKELTQIAQVQQARNRQMMVWRAAVERPRAGMLAQEEDRREEFTGQAASELRLSISQLRKQMQGPDYDRERILAQRVLDGFYIGSFYYARDLLDRRDYGPAAEVLRICLEVRPRTRGLLFDLARAYAGQKDKKKALSSLEKAVEAGFKDTARLKNTAEFESLQKEMRFQALLQGK